MMFFGGLKYRLGNVILSMVLSYTYLYIYYVFSIKSNIYIPVPRNYKKTVFTVFMYIKCDQISIWYETLIFEFM